MTTVTRICAKCGAKIFAEAPQEFCSACLLRAGLNLLTDEPVAGVADAGCNGGVPVPNKKKAAWPRKTLGDLGDYELQEEIGRGGQGLVYRARQKSLNRTVALKVIGLGHWATQEHVKRFRLEAEAAARLEHPGIVPIHEVGEHDGLCYFSMKFVEGGQLDEVARREPMPIRRAAELVAKVARTVHYAHEHGILHRDIKPGNILLDANGEPHLTDFGLARLVETESTVTRTREVLGTPSYMAPEQAMGNNATVSSATDVYGLGAVLYQLLTGQSPFAGGTSYETTRLLLDTEPRQPRLWNRKIDRDLSTICLKCLEKDPKRRYSSALALAEDLEHWLKHEPIGAKRSGFFTHACKWMRRKPAVAALIASLVAFAATLGWIVWKSEFVPHPVTNGVAVLPFENLSGDPDNVVGFRVSNSVRVKTIPSTIPEKSIAVLPFVDLSQAHDQEYFCDGISEEILDALSKVQGLRVVARTSSFSFKGKNVAVADIGQKLNVRNVLGGSLRREGNRIRITAQLVDARDGFHVWSDTFERESQGVFAVQDEITRAIVDALKVKLAVAPTSRAPQNTKAYDLYLQGLYFLNKSDEESLRKSLTLFQRALDIDPNFARAWTGIAKAWLWLADAYVRPLEAYPKMLEAASKAVALDERDAEAHCYLGKTKRVLDRNFSGEEEELKRALQIDPNLGAAHFSMSLLKSAQGELKEAIKEIQEAEGLDPLSPTICSFAVGVYLAADRAAEAINAGKRMLQLDPNFVYLDAALADAYREKGDFKEAVALYEKAQAATQFPSVGLAITYARMGRREDARHILDQLIEKSRRQYVAADSIATVYVALGEKDEAFRWLDRAWHEHSAPESGFLFHAEYRALRSDPRFADLLRRSGIDPARVQLLKSLLLIPEKSISLKP
jgi:serine/threonine protein kinase/TolB-like protein